MPDITLVEAVTHALAYELEHDENVLVIGDFVFFLEFFTKMFD